METLVEFFLELLLDGSFEVSTDKKRPRWLRVGAAVVLFAIIFGLVGLFVFFGVKSIINGEAFGATVAFTAGAFVAFIFIYAILKKLREKRCQ